MHNSGSGQLLFFVCLIVWQDCPLGKYGVVAWFVLLFTEKGCGICVFEGCSMLM